MNSELSVFYDGACHLCYREVMNYKKMDREGLLNLIDISSTQFDASKYGLNKKRVSLHMHAMDEYGNVYSGVDSFVEIWQRIPRFRFLIPLFENKFLRPGINVGYDIFARHVRPRLPKRKCNDGQCSLG